MQVVEKNKYEQIRIDRKILNGREYVDCRVYQNDEGAWKPTKKGITIPSDQIGHVIAALLRETDETEMP